MKPEQALAHRLAAEIDSELEALAALGEEFADTPKGNEIHSVRARGSILHDFYNGVARVFLRIARELNSGVPRGEQWHRDLIADMALTIPGLRPAVIDDDLALVLGEYLRFRHVFRNVYGGRLDVQRMASLEARLPETITVFRHRIEGFVCWMLGLDGDASASERLSEEGERQCPTRT